MTPERDPHQLRPDHLPTPFSAAEIRDAFVPGREVRTLTVGKGSEPYVRVRRNISGDADGGVYEVWTETPEGEPITEREEGRSTWLELQEHASMPADSTRIDDVTIEVPMGTYAGRRYTRITGDAVDTFWFAMSLPGAPVRIESRVGDVVVFSSMAIEELRP